MQPSSNSRTLEIDGMSGDACVQKVSGALMGVQGVTVQSVKVGSATISSPDQAGTHAACAAINTAGYKARETPGPSPTHSNAVAPQTACTDGSKDQACADNGAATKKVHAPVPNASVAPVTTPVLPTATRIHA